MFFRQAGCCLPSSLLPAGWADVRQGVDCGSAAGMAVAVAVTVCCCCGTHLGAECDATTWEQGRRAAAAPGVTGTLLLVRLLASAPDFTPCQSAGCALGARSVGSSDGSSSSNSSVIFGL